MGGCGKSRPPPAGIRSLDRSARSESLHLLRYPGHLSTLYKQFSKTCPLRLLFNQNLGCISCFHHACYTAVSLWKCVYIEVFMEVAVLGYYAMEQSTLQEEKRCVTYSERDTSRPMDCRDTQQDRFRFLTAGMSAREMAAVATYIHTHTHTHNTDKRAKPQYDREHMVANVTFPFTFVPVTDNYCRKCLFFHTKKVGRDVRTSHPHPQIQRH